MREFRYSSSRSNRISKFLYPSCRWDCAELKRHLSSAFWFVEWFDILKGNCSCPMATGPREQLSSLPSSCLLFSFDIQHSVADQTFILVEYLVFHLLFFSSLCPTHRHTRVRGRAPSWFFKATYQPQNKYSGFCTLCMGIRKVGNKSGMVLFSSWDAMFCVWNGITLRLYFISDHIFLNLCLSGMVLCLWCTAGRQAQGVPREWTRCKAGTS